MLRLMGHCAANRGNECRNLHKLIHAQGKTLPIDVSTVPTQVVILTGKPRVETVQYPVLFLSSWAQQSFKTGGHLFLGGHALGQSKEFRKMFATFWQRFRVLRPDLDIYNRPDVDLSTCIPVAFHGDEGRGKLRRPVMIISYQCLIGYKGPRRTNSSGFLGCTGVRAIALYMVVLYKIVF